MRRMLLGLGCTLCTVACGDAFSTPQRETTGQDVQTIGQALGKQEFTLPEPKVRLFEPPILNAEEQARQGEWERYQAAAYRRMGYRIVETVQMPVSGDIVDWVDSDSIPGAREPGPKAPVLPDSGEGPPLSKRPVMEIDQFPELKGPEGTTAIVRQQLAYTGKPGSAVSVEDFIQNHMVSGQPAGQTRLYQGRAQLQSGISTTNARTNLWDVGPIEDDTFSLTEHAIGGTKTVAGVNYTSTIGSTASRDRANFADRPAPFQLFPLLKLQLESFIINTATKAKVAGGWAVVPDSRWTPQAGAPYGPGASYAQSPSTPGGAQSMASTQWKLQDGKWYLYHEGNLLGYYKASDVYFTGANGEAPGSYWYGEVLDKTPTDWTVNKMGSGAFANQGNTYAAFIDYMYYCATGVGCPWLTNSASFASPVDPACYSIDPALGWDGTKNFFFYGGPGGDVAGCN